MIIFYMIIIGSLNSEMSELSLDESCQTYDLENIVNKPICHLHEEISAIWLAARSTLLAVFALCFQYLYSLTK